MKTNPILTFLLTTMGVMLLTSCQTNTVYFSQAARGLQRVPANGGAAVAVVPELSNVLGLACSADGQRLYAARESGIDRWGTDGCRKGLLVSAGYVACVAVDDKAGRVYWADNKHGHIASCDLTGKDARVLVTGLHSPSAVAVNPRLGWLYWCQGSQNPVDRGVWMARLDGSQKRRITSDTGLLAAVAVDNGSGRIFWSTTGRSPVPTLIMTANFDGTKPRVLVRRENCAIKGLAVDECSRRIVWTDRGLKGQPSRIRSSNFEGGEVETICEFTGESFAQAVTVGPPRKD